MKREQQNRSLKLAAALQYDGVNAPRVVAKGEGQWADRIESLARENDVPVEQDQLLSAALGAVPVGEEIPRQLYIAVAEVLSFVFFLKGKVPDGYQEKD